MKQKAYAAAGVDIDLGNRVKATLPQLLASTHRREEVLGKVGTGLADSLRSTPKNIASLFSSPAPTVWGRN